MSGNIELAKTSIESDIEGHTDIVNVATVPLLSPFRYPGGKTWLIPEIRNWLCRLSQKPKIFIEPFAGGGIASLNVAFGKLAHHVIMAELDDNVAAVWEIILTDADWLANRILNFEITLEQTNYSLSTPPINLRERAFQTILRNRVQRGGIMAPGASLMKSGENGKGIGSRWYPQTLAKRILEIYNHRDSITFMHCDAFELIPKYLERDDVVFFIDPPYTAGGKRAGKRLYIHNDLDHETLFSMMSRANGNFMMTYDDSSEVESMALKHGFLIKKAIMKNTHHNIMYELLINNNH
jgi:DNA adenine methylase